MTAWTRSSYGTTTEFAPNWRERAACLAYEPELWFPISEEGDTRRYVMQRAEAKAICAGCPVRRPCLAEALAFEAKASKAHRHGIFGGYTGSERATLAGKARKR
ncbi:WhiB family transcriptional regulator [Streptomyces sp.]|uniref:WhiB family transcriptional regulator n=1 Tax=Streptomyces sp. TaxID=1931 RepID=UPI002F94246B